MTQVDVAVLGAGPSGLTAAYCLGKAGARVTVLERAAHTGGLMRGVRRGEFQMDLGRKELYSRFGEVHGLWTELLGEDYREYAHRVGVLYGGQILEKESRYQGRLRGMSAGQVGRMAGSFLAAQVRPGGRDAASMERFYSLRYGRAYYDTFVHGFNRKFEGRSPAEMPNLDGELEVKRFGLLRGRGGEEAGAGEAADPMFSGQAVWRHPARGTQQIVDRLETGSRERGVEFLLDTEVLGMALEGGGAHRVRYRRSGEKGELVARYVVSSAPLPLLAKLLDGMPEELRTPPAEEVQFKKGTALVYLLAEGEPAFPHNWLEVNDLQLKVGRVVNYATWNGEMVPRGKTALCLEYFAVEGDAVMALDKEGLLALAVEEASGNGLVERGKIRDSLVLQMPKVNASTVIHERKQAWMREVTAYVGELPRFFETSRPGMDRATLAGMDAAEACVTGGPMRGRSLAASSKEL